MPYRSAPVISTRPVRIAAPRPVMQILFLAFMAMFWTSVGWFFGGGARVSCRRASGTCVVAHLTGPGLVSREEVVPIASIQRASIESARNDEGGRSTAIALVYGGAPHTLDAYSSGAAVSEEKKKAWVDSVNTFLGDPQRSALDVEYVSNEVFFGLAALGVAFLLGAYHLARRRVVVVIDRAAGALVVEHGSFRRTTRRLDLREVAGAHVAGGAIFLARHDGSNEPLPWTSVDDEFAKIQFTSRIARALAVA